MACRLSFERSATNTMFLFLILLVAAMMWKQAEAAPVKRNDILAGTEFLSVFINGAMAPTPRRRGFRRGNMAQDSVASESRQNEASIFRISRAPPSPKPTVVRPTHREISARLYPISHKTLEHNRQSFTAPVDDLGSNDDIGNMLKITTTTTASPQNHNHQIIRINGTRAYITHSNKAVNRKVIGVSVTSSVEATPYKVRVEHYDYDRLSVVTRPPVETPSSQLINTFSTSRTTELASTTLGISSASSTHDLSLSTTFSTSMTTKSPPSPTSSTARLVTEELSNIVSESNRSEFSVDEGLPRTSWQARSTVTRESIIEQPTPSSTLAKEEIDSVQVVSNSENIKQDFSEENSKSQEIHGELGETNEHPPQGRKAGRHYDTSLYNQPPRVYPQSSKIYNKPSKVYGKPTRIYNEQEKVYSQPELIYGEPAKVYSEPSKVYSEPSKIYSEPAKVYSEPAKVYSEPARVYSEPSKIYGEPSKVYNSEGRPVEPEEQNYEVDEAVSVGSDGNVHGPQQVTESPSNSGVEVEDGHKVGYVVEGRNFRKYRVEERTPDGFIVGEYGVVSHDDGSLRGVRYTADGTINPRLIYDALMKFLAL